MTSEEGPAARAWREQLEAWAIPPELLEHAESSPYGWRQSLWKRRSAPIQTSEEPATTELIRALLPARGQLLDIGAGRGRGSIPLAQEGHRVTAVEADAGMTQGLKEDAAAAGVEVAVIEGRWPEVAPRVARVDVAMCAHVVYDVQALARFLEAMHEVATRGVVVELTEAHPWSNLRPYYEELHGLERPDGPTADDFVAVVREVVGRDPEVERWEREGGLRFDSWNEIREFFGRRLVLPRSRWAELDTLLDVRRHGDWLMIGEPQRKLVTVWWPV